jgi:hypothetical protein
MRVAGRGIQGSAFPAVQDEPATAVAATTKAPHKPARRGSGIGTNVYSAPLTSL